MKIERQVPGSAGASPAVSCAARDTIRVSGPYTNIHMTEDFWRGAKTAGEASALPSIIANEL